MGGLDRETPRLEGRRIGAQTENALAQARVRRIEEAKKMDELENMKNVQEGLVNAFGMDGNTAGGYATMLRGGVDPRQMTGALGAQQTTDFRAQMADPTVPFDQAQRLRMATGDAAFNPTSVQGGLAFDLFAPDPYASGMTTPGEDALIRQREASAALSDERRTNPAAFRSSTTVDLGLGDLLGGADLPTRRPLGEDDVDFSGAAGLPGAYAKVVNIGADLFGADLPFPEQEKGAQELDRLRGDTLAAAQAEFPGRPSNYLLTILEPYTVRPGDLMQGAGRAFENFVTTREKLVDDFYDMHTILQNPLGVSKSDISKITLRYNKMLQLIQRYDKVIASFEAQRAPAAQPAAPDATPAPEGIDPMAWSNMTPEEKARVAELLGGGGQ